MRRVVVASKVPPLLVFGVAVSVLACYGFFSALQKRDFALSFHASGRAWIDHGTPYGLEALPNLNPPVVTALLFVPFASIDTVIAAILWTILGLGALFLSWRYLSQQLGLARFQAGTALGMLLCTSSAAGSVFLQGQLTWLLFPCAVLSWSAFRVGHPVRAGACLGILVAAKPFLCVAALVLGVVPTLVAAAVSVGLTLLSLPVTGFDPWWGWLRQSGSVQWISNPGNVSLWGLITRASGVGLMETTTITGLSPYAFVAGGIGVAAAVVCSARKNDRDIRWTLAMLTALLASPLGWTHYLPFLAPGLVALWSRGLWNDAHRAVLLTFCLPLHLVYGVVAQQHPMLLGSLFGWAALVGFGALLFMPAKTRQPGDRVPPSLTSWIFV
jgi:hypothetical protein